jgi:hypothetical protein
MQPSPALSSPLRLPVAPGIPRAQERAAHCAHYEQKCLQDRRFVELLDAYRASGGLARAQEVHVLHKRCTEPERRALTRRIAGRELISFEWQAQAWLPLFQFGRRDMALLPGLAAVLAELVPVYDGWEVAEWFVSATPALRNTAPLALLPQAWDLVLDAARMDRFILGS